MAKAELEDLAAEARHFDQHNAELRSRKDYLEISQEWLDRAMRPRGIALDYWEYAFHLLGDVRGRKVLDLGCGSGWITRLLALKGSIVTAVDVSHEGCRVTRERLNACGSPGDSIAVVDAHHLPFKEGTFDVVLTTGVLHHVSVARVAPEVHRVLKAGGRAVGYEPIKYGPLMWKIRKVWLKLNHQKEDEHTENESPLDGRDLAPLQVLFSRSLTRKMNFIAKTSRLKKRFGALANTLQWADYVLLSGLPFLRRYCTAVVFRFEKE